MLFLKLKSRSGNYALSLKYSSIYPVYSNLYVDKYLLNKLFLSKQKIDDLYKSNKGEREWKYASRLLNNFEVVNNYYGNTCSRAFFKLKEILSVFNITENLAGSERICFHLCEAPGGFIEAMGHDMQQKNIKYKWISQSMTSNKYCTPKFTNSIKNKKNGYVINYDNNDLTKIKVRKNIYDYCKTMYPLGIDIVTGDGGFDVSDNFNIQEQKSFKLIFSEVLCSMSILKKGGSFILKIFDTFTKPTLQLLNYICLNFGDVWIYKPKMSRPANGEKYIIAKNYLNEPYDEKFLVNIKENGYISDIGVVEVNIIKFNNKYINIQLNFINDVLRFIKSQSLNEKSNYKNIQNDSCYSFCKMLKII